MSRSMAVVGLVVSAGLWLAASASGQMPDPGYSSIPARIYLVGEVQGGAQPDPFGLATITIRDVANNPMPHLLVILDFSSCCDISLCSAEVGGQAVDCSSGRVTGYTDQAGQFHFTVMGSASDPGTRMPPDQYGGCRLSGVEVRVGDGQTEVIVAHTTAICLDQNAAAGQSNGTTGADVANVANLVGSVALGAPYRGRGDINFSGTITGADAAALASHVGRLILLNGVGCTGAFCARPACP